MSVEICRVEEPDIWLRHLLFPLERMGDTAKNKVKWVKYWEGRFEEAEGLRPWLSEVSGRVRSRCEGSFSGFAIAEAERLNAERGNSNAGFHGFFYASTGAIRSLLGGGVFEVFAEPLVGDRAHANLVLVHGNLLDEEGKIGLEAIEAVMATLRRCQSDDEILSAVA